MSIAPMPADVVVPRPSRTVAWRAAAALTVTWVFIRLVVFADVMFPLTYLLPLLVGVWTCDRTMVWVMASIFLVAHAAKMLIFLPADALPEGALWPNLVATSTNITIGAVVVHALIGLRERLEGTLAEVRAQSEELRAQSEELAQQNEELADQTEELSRQTEELSQQGEELASQNEELQSQSEEIVALNTVLGRREHLLETLLETARFEGGETAALTQIAVAGAEMFDEVGAMVQIHDRTGDGQLAASHPVGLAATDEAAQATIGFATLVQAQDRTAAIDDLALRPDLGVPTGDGLAPRRSALGAPIRVGGEVFGVYAVYGARPQRWTAEQFRVVEWLAGQCERTLEMLRVQSALRDADQRKSEFLATLSHELRNPLAPIRHALTLIEGGEPPGGRSLEIIKRQFRQLVRLVDDVLDATRLSSNKVQVRRSCVDLVPLVADAIEAARPALEAARHTVVVELPETPLWIDADADRIAQVVANLLNNAGRYTPPGGRIAVAAGTEGGEVVLTVTDDGVGLAAGDLHRVFDMFSQVAGPGSGGLGIGLAIVKGIVELHGGTVTAASDGLGHGTTFRVALQPGVDAVVGDGPVAVAGGALRRVLVVDDNVDAATTMAMLLEMYGHSVWVAHDARTALETAKAAVPDVALLDIGLPDLDGYELARLFRRDDSMRRIRLVAVTGWGQEDDRVRARDAGFDAHLTKPVEPERVLQML